MDSYQRIKELLVEGSLGFMKVQRQVGKRQKALDRITGPFGGTGSHKQVDRDKFDSAAGKMRKLSKNFGAKKHAKKHGEALYPFGRNKTQGLP